MQSRYNFVMVFAKALRPRVESGEITSTVRIWQRLPVKVAGAYSFENGIIMVESIEEIALDEITTEMALHSGFSSVENLLATAKHCEGKRVFSDSINGYG